MTAGDAIVRVQREAAELDLRRQAQINEQKEIINRLQRQIDWWCEQAEGPALAEFWGRVASGAFG